MVRTYTPDKARMRVSKHHVLADYWTSTAPKMKISDDVTRVISILEETLGAPVQIVLAYASASECKDKGHEPAHNRGVAVDFRPTGDWTCEAVLNIMETLLAGQGIIGYYNRGGKRKYIHFEVTKLQPKRWVIDSRKVRIPVKSLAGL